MSDRYNDMLTDLCEDWSGGKPDANDVRRYADQVIASAARDGVVLVYDEETQILSAKEADAMTKIPDTDPIFPNDFRVIATGTKNSFWAWSPDPTNSFPCLTIDCSGLASDVLQHGGVATVVWEFGLNLESGPFRDDVPVAPGLSAVQQAIADVMREVREEYEVIGRIGA